MKSSEREKGWADGEGYNKYIKEELASFRKDAWLSQLTKHFDCPKEDYHNIKILDVGTGPGFFACILAEAGFDVTAIDYSEGMLSCARENAKRLNVNPTFIQMDLEELDKEIAPETFDAVINRNVSWTLQYPKKTYEDFKRILKPGGQLIMYDANWHLHFFDEEKLKEVRAWEKICSEKFGREEVIAFDKPALFATAPLTKIQRPEWDKVTLEEMGFSVVIEEDIGKKVYEPWEQELYKFMPLFEICAIK